jgi:crotonobetainyl-CoA:carnitine CoA-transferase CaiB-like acyl-CoA transferase
VVNNAVQNDRQWLLLCEVLDLADPASDARLATNSGRLQHREEVESAVAEAVARWSTADLEAALDRKGVPWGRLNNTAEVAAHPQLEASQRWRPVELPDGGSVRVLANPFRSGNDDFRGGMPRVPALGEHTDEILSELSDETETDHGGVPGLARP